MTKSPIVAVAGIVLAGGKGTRMKSTLPKVLHPVLGVPILVRVLQSLSLAGFSSRCLVLPRNQTQFDTITDSDSDLAICAQTNQRGTGDAVAAAMLAFDGIGVPHYADGEHVRGPKISAESVLICTGDTPCIPPKLLNDFVAACTQDGAEIGLIAMKCPDPTGYGRLVLDQNQRLERIVEERDASPDVRSIDLCNTGISFASTRLLSRLLNDLSPSNAQGEYYFTDCFHLARSQGIKPKVFIAQDHSWFAGINDRIQLSLLEARMLAEVRFALMRQGVSFILPETTYIEDSVIAESDVTIEPGCFLAGNSILSKGSRIGANSVLKNVRVEAGVTVAPGTVRNDCTFGGKA
jgi:bifunctional UDP-N-acetylglucosamine pyrophosphorylase/glucosamine-1-phosphate N-acetyltransferase